MVKIEKGLDSGDLNMSKISWWRGRERIKDDH